MRNVQKLQVYLSPPFEVDWANHVRLSLLSLPLEQYQGIAVRAGSNKGTWTLANSVYHSPTARAHKAMHTCLDR